MPLLNTQMPYPVTTAIARSNKGAPNDRFDCLTILVVNVVMAGKSVARQTIAKQMVCRCIALCFLFFTQLGVAAEEIDPELREKLKSTIAQADSFVDRFDAEVWLVEKSAILKRYVADPDERLSILKEVHSAAKNTDIPPEFVLAVIEIESRFDRYAISVVGAQGMMQVMPFWKKEIGRDNDNLMNMKTNLQYGCTILKFYLDKAKGNWGEALARYNGSYGKYWYPQKVMVAWENNWR